MTTPFSSPFGSRLLAGVGTLALVASVGLFASSRPARTAPGPVPVTVANVPLPTTADDAPAKQGVQFETFAFFPNGRRNALNENAYTVPAGKRLVIETVNSRADGDTYHYSIRYQVIGGLGNASVEGFFNVVPDGSPHPTGVSHSHLYADAGDSVVVIIDRTESSGSEGINVTFTGYLVDISGPGGD